MSVWTKLAAIFTFFHGSQRAEHFEVDHWTFGLWTKDHTGGYYFLSVKKQMKQSAKPAWNLIKNLNHLLFNQKYIRAWLQITLNMLSQKKDETVVNYMPKRFLLSLTQPFFYLSLTMIYSRKFGYKFYVAFFTKYLGLRIVFIWLYMEKKIVLSILLVSNCTCTYFCTNCKNMFRNRSFWQR